MARGTNELVTEDHGLKDINTVTGSCDMVGRLVASGGRPTKPWIGTVTARTGEANIQRASGQRREGDSGMGERELTATHDDAIDKSIDFPI